MNDEKDTIIVDLIYENKFLHQEIGRLEAENKQLESDFIWLSASLVLSFLSSLIYFYIW